MNNVLPPPNSQSLSKNIIRDVTLRAKQEESDFIKGSQAIDSLSCTTQTNVVTSSVSLTDKIRQRLSPKPSPRITSSMYKVVSDQLLSEEKRQRELRRMRQIRYRKKKDAYATSLEVETRKIRMEIETLEQRQRSLMATIPTKGSVWSVATEYFRLFRYGLTTTTGTSDSSIQQDFVRKTMTLDVMFDATYGPEAMLRRWKCLSLWFEDVELELDEIKKTSADSLVASTTTSVTITERTLRNVFPHLLRNERRELIYRLLNHRIVMRGSVRFVWDSVYCRVASVFTQSDLLTPILRLLGSLEDTLLVFEKALISPDFHWRPTSA